MNDEQPFGEEKEREVVKREETGEGRGQKERSSQLSAVPVPIRPVNEAELPTGCSHVSDSS